MPPAWRRRRRSVAIGGGGGCGRGALLSSARCMAYLTHPPLRGTAMGAAGRAWRETGNGLAAMAACRPRALAQITKVALYVRGGRVNWRCQARCECQRRGRHEGAAALAHPRRPPRPSHRPQPPAPAPGRAHAAAHFSPAPTQPLRPSATRIGFQRTSRPAYTLLRSILRPPCRELCCLAWITRTPRRRPSSGPWRTCERADSRAGHARQLAPAAAAAAAAAALAATAAASCATCRNRRRRYRPGDEVHLIHVIPRLQLAATYGAPPVDFLPYQARRCWHAWPQSSRGCSAYSWLSAGSAAAGRRASCAPASPPSPACCSPLRPQDPTAYEQLIKTSEDFIARRALTHIGSISPQPVVHIVKVRRPCEDPGYRRCGSAAAGWRGSTGLAQRCPHCRRLLASTFGSRSTKLTPTASATCCARRRRSWRRR